MNSTRIILLEWEVPLPKHMVPYCSAFGPQTDPPRHTLPENSKTQLQRFAPQFTGYQQHDSQELVAFLLDGLHEDLNRVIKKPYVEKPDWEGGGDLELVHLAQKSWEGYMLRNDSVIVDLFQGQYQSTLICPEMPESGCQFEGCGIYGNR